MDRAGLNVLHYLNLYITKKLSYNSPPETYVFPTHFWGSNILNTLAQSTHENTVCTDVRDDTSAQKVTKKMGRPRIA